MQSQAVDGMSMGQQGEGTKIGGFAAGFFGGLIGALLIHFLAKSPVTKKFGWIGFAAGIVAWILFTIFFVVVIAAASTVDPVDSMGVIG